MIILGIDPGTATTGYGIVEKLGSNIRYISCGVITTEKTESSPTRLKQIFEDLNELLDEYSPDVMVTEQLFFSNNVTTALQVGRTVGILLLAAAQRNLEWYEYRPMEVKMAVVGYGAADKKQVQYMVTQLLGLKSPPKPDDAADALAVAICHANSSHIMAIKKQVGV